MTADEYKEFLGRKAGKLSVKRQFVFLSNRWFKENDLTALLLLRVLMDDLISENDCDVLYEKVNKMWEAMGN